MSWSVWVVCASLFVSAVTAATTELRNKAEFVKAGNAQCDAQLCAHVSTLDEFTQCMDASTASCYGTLNVEVWGSAEASTICKGDYNARVFHGFPNAPFISSTYFRADPVFKGALQIGFEQFATETCFMYFLSAETNPVNSPTCGLPAESTSGLKVSLPSGHQQFVIEAMYLYMINSTQVGLEGLGTSSHCGGAVVSVNYDGIQYSVDVDNRVETASPARLGVALALGLAFASLSY
eukprot:Gregarina_sp_Pseudo_9__2785@NODE_301_length_3233_cov_10_239512_g282_i0_p1_GENE_NODE_301_length_3233_cov_10_239512_g282_i0NODE_301_length_3233_cov_10_239512_g282_i0_p1_ORF_typecomplete_len236_score49_51_NODE_301_length_3233_cov_10_239512_g282_i011491856